MSESGPDKYTRPEGGSGDSSSDRRPRARDDKDAARSAERAARYKAQREGGAPSGGNRDARPQRDGQRSYGDRPQRSYGDRPQGDRPQRDGNRSYGDRPQRDGNRSYGDRPQRPQGDRPQRSFGDRPQGDRPQRDGNRSYGDRPQRPQGDRPQRSFGDRPQGDRPQRDGNRSYGDRPQRSFGDRPQGDRPQRDGNRSYGDRPQRPQGDRPQRSFGDRPQGDRPQRDGNRSYGDRPQRSFGDRPQGDRPQRDGNRSYGDRPQRGGAGRNGGENRLWTRDGAPARGDRDANRYEEELTEQQLLARELKSVRTKHEDPEIPEGITEDQLDRHSRNELKTLTKENAEWVARHLIMAAGLLEHDPELAHQHATSAARRAGRIGVVRETLAVTAYSTGDYQLALRELRTFRRITGSNENIALMVDCERALERPDRALEEGRTVDPSTLAPEARVALAIAMSGARLDQNKPELALAELQIPELDPNRAFDWSPDLFSAYAEVLGDLDRDKEAATWRKRARIAAEAIDERYNLSAAETIDITTIYEDYATDLNEDGVEIDADVDEADAEAEVEAEAEVVAEAEGLADNAADAENAADAAAIADAEAIVEGEAEAEVLTEAEEIAEDAADSEDAADAAAAPTDESAAHDESAVSEETVADTEGADAVTSEVDNTSAAADEASAPAAETEEESTDGGTVSAPEAADDNPADR
ncbi:hypothetical protein [Mycetocola tolaasinivorans]|uniref:hypothetical protein n=1 Tax=Mycetocola tolaasinivorans TaxID=76635 RepID=UPI00160307EE|nr:hypothetical protein [Mycetocola tolaasinivorans]